MRLRDKDLSNPVYYLQVKGSLHPESETHKGYQQTDELDSNGVWVINVGMSA